jgi:hypothetical protein
MKEKTEAPEPWGGLREMSMADFQRDLAGIDAGGKLTAESTKSAKK